MATADPCVPLPCGAAIVTVGGTVYPLPPLYPLNWMMSIATTSPFAITASAFASTEPDCGVPPVIVIVGAAA